ncbi:hypothetical protein H8D30_05495 [bacterium]|nr:hypothetical protein [bacterium]
MGAEDPAGPGTSVSWSQIEGGLSFGPWSGLKGIDGNPLSDSMVLEWPEPLSDTKMTGKEGENVVLVVDFQRTPQGCKGVFFQSKPKP